MDRITNSLGRNIPLDRLEGCPVIQGSHLNRRALADMFGWDSAEIARAIDCWRRLYDRQPKSTLTLLGYLGKMADAGLRPSRVGLQRGQFQLARHGDVGPYSADNCRFVPQEMNQRERRRDYQASPDFRAMARRFALARVRKTCTCGATASPGMFARWHGDKCRAAKP